MNGYKNVSSNPHVRSKVTTSGIMFAVAAALLPAAGYGVYHFGWRALMLLCVSVAACVLSEFLYEKCMGKKVTVGDFSAVVTGLLLGMNLPVAVPWWIAAIGGVFAIIVVKMLFGGLGQNFMNPALGARCFLLISFAGRMTDFTYDGVSGATPLTLLKSGETVNTLDMVIGNIPGTIGETSVIAIVLGACFLLLLGVIDLRIPAVYLITFTLFIGLFGGNGFDPYFLTAHLSGGGLMLGAFFMATDYVTSPITPAGKYVYAVILGLLTGIFRIFGGSSEGVSYAIILGNLLVPLIERTTLPKCFGKGGEKR